MRCRFAIHTPIYVHKPEMFGVQVEEVSLDEMWTVIEKFGIDRSMIEEKMNNQEIKELYLLIRNVKRK